MLMGNDAPTTSAPSPPSRLDRARHHCREHQLTLTPIRSLVLDLLDQVRTPVGAYRLGHQLEGKLGRPVAPPTVYRALAFLCRAGLAARVERCQGWVLRDDPGDTRSFALLVCSECGEVRELACAQAHEDLLRLARNRGFDPAACLMEISGACTRCLRRDP